MAASNRSAAIFALRGFVKGRPRKLGVERTASGQISRRKLDDRHHVYLLLFPDKGIGKIGCTGDVENRISQLAKSESENPILFAKFSLKSREMALWLESAASRLIASRGIKRVNRDWFDISRREAPMVASIVLAAGGDNIIGYYMMGDSEPGEDEGYSPIASSRVAAVIPHVNFEL